MKPLIFAWIVALGFSLGCTRHSGTVSEADLIDRDIAATEKQAQLLDEKIKNLSGDRDRQLIYTSERELLRSRLERLKAKKTER